MIPNSTILVVDDDAAHRTMLRTLLGGWGYNIIEADDGSTAVQKVKSRSFDLILMDIRMVEMSGLEALTKIKAINPAIPMILMTAYSSIETAVDAIRQGAFDYLTKPLDFEKLKLTIKRAMEHLNLKRENQSLKSALMANFERKQIIGQSSVMTLLLETVAQVAPSEASVLINGESGTGKEQIAWAIHQNSPRKNGPFVRVNCAALTETLLDSELFGHEKGAFTGAERRKEGRFKQAHTGSLFLDEVGEMSLGMQVKLLRVLQEKEFTRVGGEALIGVDVRIIAATNRNLSEAIREGSFREDLYYRLNVVALETPPLRNRKKDIPLLANHFLKQFNDKNQKSIKAFSPEAMDILIRYDWPGNVRELMNAVERGVVLSQGAYLGKNLLPASILNYTSKPTTAIEEPVLNTDMSLEEIEKTTILQMLRNTEGNKSEAARRLGITRKTLRNKLHKYLS